MKSAWTLSVLAPLFAYLMLASLALFRNLRRPRKLITLNIYLAFVVCVNVLGVAVHYMAAREKPYHDFFWAADILHNLVLCGLALELVYSILPKRLVVWWSGGLLLILGLVIGYSFPIARTEGFLEITLAAALVAGCILAVLAIVPGLTWTRHCGYVAAGTVCILLGSVLPAWGWLSGAAGPLLTVAIQLGPMVGLALFLMAAREQD